MSLMSTATGLPHGRPLTRTDLADMPEDGHRYELIDGTLIVSPAPTIRHQIVVRELMRILLPRVGEVHQLLPGPVDVVLADDTVIQPDLLVARAEDFTMRDLPVPPLLAIEVLSPSTRGVDLLLKRERLERAGCHHYWVVDPDEPSITAWRRGQDGRYGEPVRATGREKFSTDHPVVVGFRPADLTPS